MRLDAVARVLHDAATMDNQDSPTLDKGSWILRWIVLEIATIPRYLEKLTVNTACSATGPAWATRRTSLKSNGSLSIDTEALWINVSAKTGLPSRLSPDFLAIFGPSAQGRTIRPHLSLKIPAQPPCAEMELPLRFCDLDIMDHVNNAVHLALVEDLLHSHESYDPQLLTQVRIEFGPALMASQTAAASLWTQARSHHITLSQQGVICSQTLLAYGE